jgi:hypothetical protein
VQEKSERDRSETKRKDREHTHPGLLLFQVQDRRFDLLNSAGEERGRKG